jgi:hypothetical protein
METNKAPRTTKAQDARMALAALRAATTIPCRTCGQEVQHTARALAAHDRKHTCRSCGGNAGQHMPDCAAEAQQRQAEKDAWSGQGHWDEGWRIDQMQG